MAADAPSALDTIAVDVLLPDTSARRPARALRIPDIRVVESVASLKSLLLDVPELSHISNCCHLEAVPRTELARRQEPTGSAGASGKKKKSKVRAKRRSHIPVGVQLNDAVELAACPELMRGDFVVLVPDPYSVQEAWDHVDHLNRVLASPPGPLVNVAQLDLADPANLASPVPDAESQVDPAKEPTAGTASEQQLPDGDAQPSAASAEPSNDKSAAHDKTQRLHERRERVLANMPTQGVPVPVHLDSLYPGPRQEADGVWEHGLASLTDDPLPQCLKELLASAWNPPPAPRKLMGDLLYLRARTLDDRVFHITGTRGGFFINRSTDTAFDSQPAVASHHAQTLAELLSAACPQFARSFAKLISIGAERMQRIVKTSGLTDFDLASLGTGVVQTARSSAPWVARPNTDGHQPNTERAYRATYDRFGLAQQAGNLRDWNEDFQSCLELPCSTLDERVVRSRLLDRLHADFVANAKLGAIAIAEGSLQPLNPSDPPESHVFIFNSAFFSLARLDLSCAGSSTEDDAKATNPVATYSSANHDLNGVIALSHSIEKQRTRSFAEEKGASAQNEDGPPAPQLHTLNTAVVDYLGKRVIAQTIVPGVLQNEQTAALLYGSVDSAASIACDPTFDGLLEQATAPLCITASKVRAAQPTEGSAEACVLHAPATCKGLRGSEGRLYVLDLMRLTPVDLHYYNARGETDPLPTVTEEASYVALLRPELVSNLVRYRQAQFQARRKAAAQAVVQQFRDRRTKISSDQDADKPATMANDGKDEAAAAEWDDATRKEIEHAVKEALQAIDEPALPRVDPNLCSSFQATKDADPQAVADARALASFLIEQQIPKLVDDLRNSVLTISDGTSLTKAVHSYGINLRYLGRVASLAVEAEDLRVEVASVEDDGETGEREVVVPTPPVSESFFELCEIEMVARTAKWLFRHVMDVVEQPPAIVIAALLSALVGSGTSTSPAKQASAADAEGLWSDAVSKLRDPTAASPAQLGHVVAAAIRSRVSKHFGHQLVSWCAEGASAEQSSNAAGQALAGDGATKNRAVPLALLRRIGQLCGVSVAAREIDFSAPQPFSPADIQDVRPIVKSCRPEWCLPEVQDLLETAKVHLQLQNKADLQKAYRLANEALSLVCQVSGPAHRNAVSCCLLIANVMQSAGDMAHAIQHQKRALALLAVLGEHDTAMVAQCYGNLATLFQADGDFDLAVRCARRAVFLFELMCGPRNAEAAFLYQRMATSFATAGDYSRSFDAIQEAVRCCGRNHLQQARFLRTAAHILSGTSNYRASFQCEKSAYSILKQILGPTDPRTQECFKAVERYTRLSVEQMRQEGKSD